MCRQFSAGEKWGCFGLCKLRLWDVSLVLHPFEIWVLIFPSQSCKNIGRGRKAASKI